MNARHDDTVRVCPVCSKPLPSDAPRGFCPVCLISTASGDASARPTGGPISRVFDYELLGELAHGGMGIVYYARQISLNRAVALKMIRSGQFATPAEVERFRTEAEAAANLDHPHIVPIYEIGETNGEHYFSMKLIEGGNLAERIAGTRHSIADSARLIAKIARAVHHAHQRGVLHRDIKPTNILIDEQGEPHLTDFGLAKLLQERSDITQTISVLGTPSYMAPEQAEGRTKQLTTAGDIYSLGAILYELLAGRPPFLGETALEILAQVTSREPEPLRRLNSSVDRDLETICLKCLEKEPPKRYASAEALADDLERWLAHKPIAARPTTSRERFVKWTRRNPSVAALSLAALLILVCGIAGVFVQWRRAETNSASAQLNARQSRERLVRLNVANGIQLLDKDDSFRALVWFAEALKLDAGDPAREASHRLRIATTMEQCPKLLQFWTPVGAVQSAEFSRDGALVLAASGSNTISIWKTDTGERAARFIHPDDSERITAHFDRDGTLIASSGGDLASVWNATTGKLLRTVKHSNVVHAIFLPGRHSVATASAGGSVKVWNLDTGEEAFKVPRHRGLVVSLAASSDGRLLLAASTASVRVTDCATGATVAEWKTKGLLRHAEFDPTGHRIVTAHWDWEDLKRENPRGYAQVWDASTGKALTNSMKESTWIEHATFSPDGNYVSTSAGGHVGRVWNAERGNRTAQLSGHKNVVVSSAFSADGKSIVTCSFDGTARVHALEGKSLSPPILHGGLVTAGAFHPDGKRLLTASADGTVRIWSIAESHVPDVPFTDPETRFVNTLRDGSAVMLQDRSNALHVFDTATWKPIASVKLSKPILNAWFNQPAHLLMTDSVTETNDQYVFQVERWDTVSGRLLRSTSIPSEPMNFIGSPTCSWFALVNQERADIFAGDGQKKFSLRAARATVSLEFSRNDKFLLLAFSNTVEVIALETGRRVYELPHPYKVADAEFSPDTRYIVSATLDSALAPRSAYLWDVQTGRPAGAPLAHADGVFRATFSRDARVVLTASEDGTARLWSVPQGMPTTPPLRHSVAVYDASFSADGRLVATASQDETARVWDARTGEPLTPRLKNNWRVWQVMFLADGQYLLTRSTPVRRGDTWTMNMRLWNLPRDDKPVDDLLQFVTLLTGHTLDTTGNPVPVSNAVLEKTWHDLQPRYPGAFSMSTANSSRAKDIRLF